MIEVLLFLRSRHLFIIYYTKSIALCQMCVTINIMKRKFKQLPGLTISEPNSDAFILTSPYKVEYEHHMWVYRQFIQSTWNDVLSKDIGFVQYLKQEIDDKVLPIVKKKYPESYVKSTPYRPGQPETAENVFSQILNPEGLEIRVCYHIFVKKEVKK